MKCVKCWSEDIVLIEYTWAYDWRLVRECQTCWEEELKETWGIVVASIQHPEYWPLYSYISKDWKLLKYVNQHLYNYSKNWEEAFKLLDLESL